MFDTASHGSLLHTQANKWYMCLVYVQVLHRWQLGLCSPVLTYVCAGCDLVWSTQ